MDFKKLTDNEIDNYLSTVLNMADSRVLISPLMVTYSDFIQPKTPCMANVAKAHAFIMDCTDDYKKFLQFFRDSKADESLMQKIQAVDIYMNKYFGARKNEEQRQSINLSNPDFHSIEKYKEQSCAMCFERAIFTHNLLKLLGLNSTLVTKNYHTYNIIKYKKSLYIYDPTNPTIADLNGQLARFPSVRAINGNQIEKYLYGNQSIFINPSFYEMMYGAKNVRTPKYEYVGLGLQKSSATTAFDDIEDSL